MDMEKEIKILNIDDILPNRFQPRIHFNEKNINELADSIKEHGVIQPIVVRKISDKYEIIAGERRYKASILAGKTTIPAIVTNLDDKNSAEIALIENVQRQDLTPIEEAVSYKKILDMGYINQTELAEKLGKTQSTIANKLRLLNLDDEVQEALLDGKISERHARSLLRLENKNQVNMLSRIINERLTVRRTDEEVEKMLNIKSSNTKPEEINKESVEITMNEEIKNEFNIPNNPIYQDEKPNIEPINSINPGFMDISKIENDAEDIFKPEVRADMDSLLENNISYENIESPMAPIPETNIEDKNEQPKGKFFNMFNFNNKNDNPNFVENIESKETNIDFGLPKKEESSFNPFEISEQPSFSNNIVENNNFEEEKINNVDNTQSEFNPFNIDTDNSFDINKEANSNYEEIKPIENEEELFKSINMNSYHLNDDSEFTNKYENSFEEVKPFEPVPNSFEEVKPFESVPNSFEEVKPFEPVPNNFEEVKPFEPVPNSFEEVKPFESVSNNFEEVKSFEPIQNSFEEVKPFEPVPNSFEEVKPFEPVPNSFEEVKPFESISEQKYVTADFKTIINTIRNCAETIEKYGYKVDIEELDFENSYQVNFKIEK